MARLRYLHSLMSKTEGFVEAQVWEFLGNPAQNLVVRTWTEEAAHKAYRASDASKEFAASRPSHFIYENYAVEEWDCVIDTTGAGPVGDYLVWLRQTIEPSTIASVLATAGRKTRRRSPPAALAS